MVKKNEKVYRLGEYLYTPCSAIGEPWTSSDENVAKQARLRKYTTLFLRTYENEDTFVDILRSLETCDAWAYIVHDKDVNEDGSPKQTHIHALLHFPPSCRVRLTTLAKLFKQNTRVETPLDVSGCWDYMVHANSPEKYQYDELERKAHNQGILLGARASSDAKREEERQASNKAFLDDLANLSPYEMSVRYGRDYIKNHSRYTEFRNLYLSDCEENEITEDYDIRRKASQYDLLTERLGEALFRHQPTEESVPYNGYEVITELARKLREYERLPSLEDLVNAYCDALKMVAPRQDFILDGFNYCRKDTKYCYNPYKE